MGSQLLGPHPLCVWTKHGTSREQARSHTLHSSAMNVDICPRTRLLWQPLLQEGHIHMLCDLVHALTVLRGFTVQAPPTHTCRHCWQMKWHCLSLWHMFHCCVHLLTLGFTEVGHKTLVGKRRTTVASKWLCTHWPASQGMSLPTGKPSPAGVHLSTWSKFHCDPTRIHHLFPDEHLQIPPTQVWNDSGACCSSGCHPESLVHNNAAP